MIRRLDHILRRVTARFRMQPGFLLVGAMKAGTTSLFDRMMEHPWVGAPRVKEIAYFSKHHHRGPAWYRSHFPLKRTGGPRLTGEASTSYLMMSDVVAPRIARFDPEMRLLVVLRDPVDRAVSHYWWEVRQGREVRTLQEAIDGELSDGVRGHVPSVANPRQNLRSNVNRYLYGSLYADRLAPFREVFGRENLLLLGFRDLLERPRRSWARIAEWLQIDDLWGEAALPGSNRSVYPETPPEVRRRLENYFEEPSRRLSKAIGEELRW